MREEYMIERQGKRFVLYAGLLEEAHERGVRSIETELLQVPAAENGEVAIVKARVVMDLVSEPDNPLRNSFGNAYSDGDHPRTVERAFEGIGDASPQNVGRMIAPHLIRMAETRAKARALRDAINVGATAFEELGGEDQGAADERQGERPGPRAVPDQAQDNAARDGMPATRKQLNYLENLVADVVEDGITRFEEMVGKPIGELTRGEASEWIGRLSGRAS